MSESVVHTLRIPPAKASRQIGEILASKLILHSQLLFMYQRLFKAAGNGTVPYTRVTGPGFPNAAAHRDERDSIDHPSSPAWTPRLRHLHVAIRLRDVIRTWTAGR